MENILRNMGVTIWIELFYNFSLLINFMNLNGLKYEYTKFKQ